MPFQTKCPNCLNSFRVADNFDGCKGKCPKCQNVFVISREEEPSPPKNMSWLDDEDDPLPPTPPATRWDDKFRSLRLLAAGHGALGILTILSGVVISVTFISQENVIAAVTVFLSSITGSMWFMLIRESIFLALKCEEHLRSITFDQQSR